MNVIYNLILVEKDVIRREERFARIFAPTSVIQANVNRVISKDLLSPVNAGNHKEQ
jgi:hypothetical protein